MDHVALLVNPYGLAQPGIVDSSSAAQHKYEVVINERPHAGLLIEQPFPDGDPGGKVAPEQPTVGFVGSVVPRRGMPALRAVGYRRNPVVNGEGLRVGPLRRLRPRKADLERLKGRTSTTGHLFA